MSELRELVERQMEYLARYGDIMNEIQHLLAKLSKRRLRSITALRLTEPNVPTYNCRTINIDSRIDVPQWLSFSFYGCREPHLSGASIYPNRIDLVFMCGKKRDVKYFYIEGEVSLFDVIKLSGLPEDVWGVLFDAAKEVHQDTYRNLESVHGLVALIRDVVLSLRLSPEISRDAKYYESNFRIYKDAILNLANVYETLGNIQCPCINMGALDSIRYDMEYINISVFPYMKIEQIDSRRVFNKRVKISDWLFSVRGYRAYEKLIDVDLVKSDIVLHLRYERANGSREIEDVYFVDRGNVFLGNLVLASYILDDETWKWILEEATNYLVLARETDVVLNEYLLPAIKLVS
jgi:hypothetical protein